MLQQNEKRHHHCALFTLKNHGVHQVYICIISFFSKPTESAESDG